MKLTTAQETYIWRIYYNFSYRPFTAPQLAVFLPKALRRRVLLALVEKQLLIVVGKNNFGDSGEKDEDVYILNRQLFEKWKQVIDVNNEADWIMANI